MQSNSRTSLPIQSGVGNPVGPDANVIRPRRGVNPVGRRVLFQVIVCAIIPSVLMGLGQFSYAGQMFWGLLMLCVLIGFIMGRPSELLCVVVGLFPLINQLRGFGIFYSIVPVLLIIVLAFFSYVHRGSLSALVRSNGLLSLLLLFLLVYYLASYVNMKSYDANIRLLEFGLAVLCVYVLVSQQKLLMVALQGVAISSIAVSLGLLPHLDPTGGRLGIVVQDGESIGNPITLGLPLAFILLAAVADRGRWLGLEKRTAVRGLIVLAVAVPLVLSSSRVSWMIAAVGLLATIVLGGRKRWGMIGIVAGIVLLVNALLLSPYGEAIHRGMERTFSDERSAANRTSGRSDQWLVAEYVFTKSAENMLLGYGPGRGVDIYERYSARIPGITYSVGSRAAWHAFFMQLAVEIGLIGSLPFVMGLLVAVGRVLVWTRRTKVLFPIMCILGYLVIIFTVSGSDTVSASLLAIGLYHARRTPKGKVRVVKRRPAITSPEDTVGTPDQSRTV